MPKTVRDTLLSIGLTDKEALVFLILLQYGPLYAANVARMAKVNRTTTYGILKELMSRGLVSIVNRKDEAARYQSIEPEMLPAFLERQREELALHKKEIEQALPQIALLRSNGKVLPKVHFFEGTQGVEQAYEDMLAHNTGKMIYALTGLEGAMTGGLSEKFRDYFIGKRTSLGIAAEYIIPDTPIARKATLDDAAKLRVPKFIPGEYNFNIELCIYDNRVSILSYSQESPVALIIEDETIAHAMKQIFRYIDSTAKSD